MFKVMVVEDDLIAAKYLKRIIESLKDFKVFFIVRSYKEALSCLKQEQIDIVFIDIKLAGKKSGIDLAKTISDSFSNTFFIFLTAYSNSEFIQEAAKTKAFNYLLKPYRPQEIEAVLILAKDSLNKEKGAVLNLVDNYAFNMLSRRLYKNGKEVVLAPKELALIEYLAKNSNIIVSKEALMNLLDTSEEALNSLIYRIRTITSKAIISTFKGIGYKITTKRSLSSS